MQGATCCSFTVHALCCNVLCAKFSSFDKWQPCYAQRTNACSTACRHDVDHRALTGMNFRRFWIRPGVSPAMRTDLLENLQWHLWWCCSDRSHIAIFFCCQYSCCRGITYSGMPVLWNDSGLAFRCAKVLVTHLEGWVWQSLARSFLAGLRCYSKLMVSMCAGIDPCQPNFDSGREHPNIIRSSTLTFLFNRTSTYYRLRSLTFYVGNSVTWRPFNHQSENIHMTVHIALHMVHRYL